MADPYVTAQQAIASLKGAVYAVLNSSPAIGLQNAQIGRALGIHQGHGIQHAGHISRTLLETMQAEGVVRQDAESKLWSIVNITGNDDDNGDQ